MKLICILIILSMSSLPQFANSQVKNIWEEVDVRYYYPLDQGIRDLSFVIKQKGLEDYVKKSFALKNVKNLAVKVFYLQPDALRVEVLGLPDGFNELKAKIKSIVAPYIAFAIPTRFIDRYQTYQFTKINKNKGYVLKGVDPKYQSAIPEFKMEFDRDSRLVRTSANTPQGSNQTIFDYTRKSWSNGKYILKNMTSTTRNKITINSVETKISYEKVAGHGFPYSISIVNRVDLTKEAKKLEQFKEQSSTKIETVVSFSEYKVNKGDAKKKIYRTIKKVQ